MAKIIEARVLQKIDTEQNWNTNELILYKGEIALVGDPDRVYNIKVGNGFKKFRDLPYMVDYISGLYTQKITPQSQVPSGVNNVFLVSEQGTYTNFGGMVLPKDNLGIIYKNGSNFTIQLIPIVSEEKLQKYIDEKLVDINVGFGGEILTLNQSPNVQGMYIPKISGVYPDFGSLEYDPVEGFTLFLYKDSQFSKVVVPLNAVEVDVNFNNNSLGVSGSAVEKYAVKKINTIENLRSTSGEYENQIVTLLGYYEAGDKDPLNYKYTTKQGVDDGGAVINTINGSWIAIFDKNIKVSSFGCINSKTQNSNAQFQNTINYAVLNKKDIDIDIDIYISETININRVVDGEDSSDYMYISGGSITVAKDLELFSSSLTYFPNEPASQLIYFKNINLIGDGSNFFMKGNKLLRIIISGCSFLKLNFCRTDYYIQSIYFDNCNIRDIKDCFLTATNGSYDLRFTNNLVERGDNFIDISGGDLHNGQLWVDGNVIEGFSGYAIRYSDMSVMTITNNYFESNSLGDVVKNSNKTDTMDTLIIIENNFMYGTGIDNTGGNGFFHVVLGWASRGSFSKNVGGNRNLVYLKSICGMSIEDNFGDHTINKVGKRSKMYFYEDLSGEATAYEDYIEKGSIIWNTDIKDGNSWIGAICTSDKLNYIESTWLKFGEDFVKNKVLISSSNLNDFTQSGVFFSENSIIKNIENNFPISEVGVLEVLADNDPDRSNFMQRYTSMITNTVFTRTYYGTGGSWTPWFNLTNKDVNSPDATDLNTAITLVNELKQKLAF